MCLMTTLEHRAICKCKIHWNGEWRFTFLKNLIFTSAPLSVTQKTPKSHQSNVAFCFQEYWKEQE